MSFRWNRNVFAGRCSSKQVKYVLIKKHHNAQALWCFVRLHYNFSVSHINLNLISFIKKQADFLLGRDSP
nr:MAG TPA: hypothetical protein [Caudoviricetes sp.]DAP50468.1 MAG TPA: hypothetical protein [Caudoviricetes sp.]